MLAPSPTPYTTEEGLRDYRASVLVDAARGPRWPYLIVLAFLLGFLCGTKAHGADHCVQLQVRPIVMLQPSDIRVETRVCRQSNHRTLLVTWNSDRAGAGSSLTELQGEASPALFTRWLPHQPAANYQFDAAVYDGRGKVVGRDRARIVSVDFASQ